MKTKLISLQTFLLIVIVMFTFNTRVYAQVDTKVNQRFSVYDRQGWRKYFYPGTPITIFAYKKKNDLYNFGIYTDDYAGLIELKLNPFAAEEKQLKKLPNINGKTAEQKLIEYYKLACAKAREKSLSGKYKTIASCNLYGKAYDHEGTVSKHDTITIIGYKEVKDFLGSTSYYAIVNNQSAGVFKTMIDEHLPVIDIPLSNLPSTDDSQVKSIIAREKRRIRDKREALEEKAREKRIAQNKALEEQRMANLRLMDPAYIEVKGWNMDSAGGIGVNITFTNCDRFHSIKYVYFQGYFLNAVGDKCRNSVTGSTVWKYKGVGPINPFPSKPGQYGQSYIANFCFDDPLFYAKTAHTFRLSSVTIEYLNGKKKVLTGDELDVRVEYTD